MRSSGLPHEGEALDGAMTEVVPGSPATGRSWRTGRPLAGDGVRPADLRVNQPPLEDVFLEITGHALDEG
jgi:hypothetical protein